MSYSPNQIEVLKELANGDKLRYDSTGVFMATPTHGCEVGHIVDRRTLARFDNEHLVTMVAYKGEIIYYGITEKGRKIVAKLTASNADEKTK